MIQLDTLQTVPLTQWEDGSIRVTGSRVPIDSILYHYKLGSTAEQIAVKFGGLHLADIHLVIAYYLQHRHEIDRYLRRQEAEGDAMQQRLESDPNYKSAMTEMRERLLARWAARQQETSPPAEK